MRKSALVLALVMIASAPTAALAAKAKAKAPADPNWAGKKFVQALAMQPYAVWQSSWGVKPKAAKKKK